MSEAPTIVADGVVLTAVTEADAEAWLASEDDAQVTAFEFPQTSTLEDVHRAIAMWQSGWATDGPVRQWALRDGTTGELAGGVELRAMGDWRVANLSYVVFPRFRGREFAFAASRAAIQFARAELGTETISLEILQGNASSRRVAEKLGARWVGTSPSHQGSTFDRWHVDTAAVAPEES